MDPVTIFSSSRARSTPTPAPARSARRPRRVSSPSPPTVWGCSSASLPRASSWITTPWRAVTTGRPSGPIRRCLRSWSRHSSCSRSATRGSRMPSPSNKPGPPGTPADGAFRPRPMKLSILTAALQELTPRERREADPDLAIEEWLAFAAEIGAPNIELSCALHPTQSDVPAAALLDPVANTLDLRKPFTAARATRVESAMRSTGVGLSELGYFDNMLAADDSSRRVKHELMLRVFDAAVLLRCDAVEGFVGRNAGIGMDANLDMFEQVFVPLLREAKARGLTYLVEQCPMPGWNVTDAWHNNIAYAPGPWIELHRICE